ncbi:LOW QUALITY PROTEIN: hypothetical protein ACHAXT_007959 [Thalassiosira profunda]
MKRAHLLLGAAAVRPAASFSTLITFDVDGTLVSSSEGWERGAHGRSFVHAVDSILGGNERGAAAKKTIPELLEKHEFHGSTDGLILLRLARKMLGPSYDDQLASSKVDELMDEMFRFVSTCSDDEVAVGIAPLPGVLDTLETLAREHTVSKEGGAVAYGLVTGNVEGIARRKMRALGICDTNALTPLPRPQGGREWEGVEDTRFLGGFGSDYCSGCIDVPARNYLDRGEQLAICVRRCLDLSAQKAESSQQRQLDRVIHVGDAPADILWRPTRHTRRNPQARAVVGVATGSYAVEELTELCGEPVPGEWEPVVLDEGAGVGDTEVFLRACGLI